MSDLLSQASLVMIPSGYKEDVVYSPIPTNGNGDLSFTRASNGTRINSAGLVEVTPWNLLPNSEVFALYNTVLIGGSTITVTDNFVTAPNGTLTAAKVVFSIFNDFAQLFQFYSLAPTQNLTATLYAKVPSGTRVCNFGFYDGAFKNQQKTLTTEWQRIEFTGSIDAGSIRACWFYGEGGASNVEVHLWGGQLNVGSTAKPYFPTTDRLNVPRLTYQNGGGGCPSLLLEKQSTNLTLYSQDLGNAVHNLLNVTIAPNNTTSPDGTQNADKLTETTGNGEHIIYDLQSNSAGVYTLSCFLKQGSGTIYPVLRLNNAGNGDYALIIFDFTSGTVINTSNVGYGTPTYTVANLGNGWYRVTMTCTTTGTFGGFRLAASNSTTPTFGGSGAITYTGSTSNYFYVYGAQLEASSYPTSYIPTTSSSATRVADACFKTGISSLIGQTEGVLFVDFNFENTPDVNGNIVMIIHGASGEAFIYILGGNLLLQVYNSGVAQGNISISIGAVGRKKVALAYKQNDFVGYMNGTQIGTDTSGTIPAMSTLRLGEYYATGYSLNSGINEAVLFPTRLTNAELASLTTL